MLQGTYINYFHCLRIVDLLKETEAGSKNMFGRSQRMKGNKIKSELLSLVKHLPAEFDKITTATRDLKEPVNLYEMFIEFTLKKTPDTLSCPAHPMLPNRFITRYDVNTTMPRRPLKFQEMVGFGQGTGIGSDILSLLSHLFAKYEVLKMLGIAPCEVLPNVNDACLYKWYILDTYGEG
ncbi:uncharacterized protein LOC135501342 isoform X2 [Lineus longissimus]|uniref:uncharacterized protein LOC135501342 isoform X2 n=1 Tax=Lineus longissimus TaxID=88925 RepID=UPI00315D577E